MKPASAGRPAWPSRLPREPYDSSVLFVHGIGWQQPGDTVRIFGGELVECLQTLVGRSGVIEVTSPSIGNAPAHVECRIIYDEPSERTQTWLLAESCWANSFSRPKGRWAGEPQSLHQRRD